MAKQNDWSGTITRSCIVDEIEEACRGMNLRNSKLLEELLSISNERDQQLTPKNLGHIMCSNVPGIVYGQNFSGNTTSGRSVGGRAAGDTGSESESAQVIGGGLSDEALELLGSYLDGWLGPKERQGPKNTSPDSPVPKSLSGKEVEECKEEGKVQSIKSEGDPVPEPEPGELESQGSAVSSATSERGDTSSSQEANRAESPGTKSTLEQGEPEPAETEVVVVLSPRERLMGAGLAPSLCAPLLRRLKGQGAQNVEGSGQEVTPWAITESQLYRAVVGHPVVSGRTPSGSGLFGSVMSGSLSAHRDQLSRSAAAAARRRRRKEKKDKMKRRGADNKLCIEEPFVPDLSGPPLPSGELCKQMAVFVTKAAAEGGAQALLIAAQVAFATFLCPSTATIGPDEDVPLRGAIPTKHATSFALNVSESPALPPDTQLSLGPVLYLMFDQLGVSPNPFVAFKLAPRQKSNRKSPVPVEGEGEDQPLLGGAEGDEAMLLAQALALSMKEIEEDDPDYNEEREMQTSLLERKKSGERKTEEPVEEKGSEKDGESMAKLEHFSPAYMLQLPPFGLAAGARRPQTDPTHEHEGKEEGMPNGQDGSGGHVLAEAAVLGILAYLDAQSRTYMTSVHEGSKKVSVPAAVAPHGTLFRLLRSLLHQLSEDLKAARALAVAQRFAAEEDEEVDPLGRGLRDKDFGLKNSSHEGSVRGLGAEKAGSWRERLYRRRLFLACAIISALKILQANFTQVERAGLPLTSVGLGPKSPCLLPSKTAQAQHLAEQVPLPSDFADDDSEISQACSTPTPIETEDGSPVGSTPTSTPKMSSKKGTSPSGRKFPIVASQEQGTQSLAAQLRALLEDLLSGTSPESDPQLTLTLAMPTTVPVREQALLEQCLQAERTVQLCALEAWGAGLALLVPTHSARHALLAHLFAEVPVAAAIPGLEVEQCGEITMQRRQLDLLCTRMAQPDLARHFLTTTRLVSADDMSGGSSSLGAVGREADEGDNRLSREEVLGHLRALLPGGDHGTAGEGAVQRMYQALYESKETSTADGSEPLPKDDSLATMLLASLASSSASSRRNQEREAQSSSVTHLEEASADKPSSTWMDEEEAVSPELFPQLLATLVERLRHPALADVMESTVPAELVLLRALQHQLCQLVGLTSGSSNGSDGRSVHLPGLGVGRGSQTSGSRKSSVNERGDKKEVDGEVVFDPKRGSGNILLSDRQRRAKQKPSKSWGSILAKGGYKPNSGIHEWLIRLDQCEKGHVFLGVATTNASINTYVGGDRHGWGLIGTRALWHGRSKVTGDYGEGYTTGSVVRVRLDTDSGTLSYGSPTQDWGIAFENLPRDETLYPAVGLYQKDDQVTLLSVMPDTPPTGAAQVSALAQQAAKNYAPFLQYAQMLLEAVQTLALSPGSTTTGGAFRILRHPLTTLVAPLTAALLLAPRRPFAAGLVATQLLPPLTALTKKFDDLMDLLKATGDTTSEFSSTQNILGTWEISSSAADNIPAQEYEITLKAHRQNKDGRLHPFVGSGKGGHSTVEIKGLCQGVRIVFLETWRQGGTCLVEGHMSLMGDYFHGTYRDTRSGSKGFFEARRLSPLVQDDDEVSSSSQTSQQRSIQEVGSVDRRATALHSLPTPAGAATTAATLCASLAGKFASWLMAGVEVLACTDSDKEADESVDLAAEEQTESKWDDPIKEEKKEMDKDELKDAAAEDGQSELVSEWLKSSLFESGLPLAALLPQSNTTLQYYTQDLKNTYRWWLDTVVPCAEQTPPPSPSKASVTVQDFALQISTGIGSGGSVDACVSSVVGQSPFLKLIRDPAERAKWEEVRLSVTAALLVHTGAVQLAIDLDPNEKKQDLPDRLKGVWQASRQLVEWALRAARHRSDSHPTKTPDCMLKKAQFLLRLQPCPSALSMSRTQANDPYPEALAESCLSFFKSNIFRLDLLQDAMVQASTQAVFRVVGLRSLSLILGKVSEVGGHALPTRVPGLEVLHALLDTPPKSMVIIGASAQFLPSALQGQPDPFHDIFVQDMGDIQPSHFYEQVGVLEGLSGVSRPLTKAARNAHEILMGQSLKYLSRAEELDMQLLFVQALGVALKGGLDQSFLVRSDLLGQLHQIIGAVRTPAQWANIEDSFCWKLTIGARSRLARAALSVIEFLVSQVAKWNNSKDAREPEAKTLAASVMNLLHSEILSCFTTITLSHASTRKAESSKGEDIPNIVQAKEGEDLLRPHRYCYKLLYLLGLLSRSEGCQRLLISPHWIRLLFAGLVVPYPVGQRRLLRLMRMVLRLVDPSKSMVKLSADTDLLNVLNGPNGDKKDTDAQVLGKEVMGVLCDLVASFAPTLRVDLIEGPSQSEEATPFTNPADESTDMGFVAPVVAETVTLMRALHEEESWTSYINEIVHAGLGKLQDNGNNMLLESLEEEVFSKPDNDGELRFDYKECQDKAASWFAKDGARDALLSAIAGLGISGGFVDGLHVGGVLLLRPFSLVGVSESLALRLAAVAHTAGICVGMDRNKRTAEVVLVEKDRQVSMSGGVASFSSSTKIIRSGSGAAISFSGGMPVRPVKMGIEDLIPMPEASPALKQLSTNASSAILSALMENSVPWLLRRMNQAANSVFEAEDMSESKDESGEGDGKEEEAASTPTLEELKARRLEFARLGDSLALQSAYVVASFRAGSQVLTEAEDIEAFLEGHQNPERTLRLLLQAAVSETQSNGGLSSLDTVEEAWVESWGRWYQACSEYRRTALEKKSKPDDKDVPPDGQQEPGSARSGGGGSGSEADSLGQALSNISLTAAMSLAAGAQQGTLVMDTSAAVEQMMEMGFPREWCQAALRRCGNIVEQAVNFCFEHGGEMDQILAEEQALSAAASAAAAARGASGSSMARHTEAARRSLERTLFTKQLVEMGFPPSWCVKALAASRNNVDAALTWILTHGEALAAEDQEEDSKDLEAEATGIESEAADSTTESKEAEDHGPNPLKMVSGESSIADDLSVDGVAAGGFASVGSRGCLLTQGKWYFEVTLKTAGCMQIGWADCGYLGNAETGDGVGDGPHSWAYDGWRQCRWHDGSCDWGARWAVGDVIGAACDLDARTISFYLNGRGEEIGMGEAFSGYTFSGGLFPCVSFNRREKVQFNFGHREFKFAPPEGYRPVIEAVNTAIVRFKTLHESLVGSDVKEIFESKSEAVYHEDCMEEELRGESFLWHTRYFDQDVSVPQESLTVRGWCGDSLGPIHRLRHSTDHLKQPGAEMAEEDEELDTLLALACDLCVLYARQACLALLARWEDAKPTKRGTHHLRAFLTAAASEEGTQFGELFPDALERLLQLAAVEGPDAAQAHMANTVPVHFRGRPSSEELLSAFRAGGVSALKKLAPVLMHTDSAVLREFSFQERLLQLVGRQVLHASGREFSTILSPAFSPAGLQQKELSDCEALRHPNLGLAIWLSSLLLEMQLKQGIESSEAVNLVLQLCEIWAIALTSANLMVKLLGASILSGLLREADVGRLSEATTVKQKLGDRLDGVLVNRLAQLTVRRVWSERTSAPIYSRYLQGLVELCCTLVASQDGASSGPLEDLSNLAMPPAVPLALPPGKTDCPAYSREWDQGYSLSDEGWEFFSGTVTQHALDWEKPPRSCLQLGLESNNGPPPLLPGCSVIRGPDFDSRPSDADESGTGASPSEMNEAGEVEEVVSDELDNMLKKDEVGVVVEIIEWGGISGLGRSVRWPNGDVGRYRWGGEGRFDLKHVEVDGNGKITKRHSLPETREDRASQRGFGNEIHFGVILHIRPFVGGKAEESKDELDNDEAPDCSPFEGILEWPDFCAASAVEGKRWSDGTLQFTETKLLWGSYDHGWDARFGESNWRNGISYNLTPSFLPGMTLGDFDDPNRLLGDFSYSVVLGGKSLQVVGDMRLGKRDLFALNTHAKNSNIVISQDGRSASCASSECRGTCYGTVGFSRGVHYWEVKVEQADPGSVFIGVAEKPGVPGVPGGLPRLSRWQGWGFVNYRATYHKNNERVYGEHFCPGDTVGVRLDMNRGHLSFFLDGMKYGEHIVSDLGLAFDGLTGGKPRVRPRTLFPVLGFRKSGDRITLTSKWVSGLGVHPSALLEDAISTTKMLESWARAPQNQPKLVSEPHNDPLPRSMYLDAWRDARRWRTGRWVRVQTRAPGELAVDLDRSPLSCIKAGLLLGISEPLFAGDKVRLTRSCGRVLDAPEEATVLGAYHGTLWYQLATQNDSSSGSAGTAWCWTSCEMEGVKVVQRAPNVPPTVLSVPLGKLVHFQGAKLRIIFDNDAVIRDGIEIDTSQILGKVDSGAVVTALERRVNSSSVARYLVKYKGTTGWISERIRGGDEQLIVERLPPTEKQEKGLGMLDYELAAWEDRVRLQEGGAVWLESYQEKQVSFETFHALARGTQGGWSRELDRELVSAVTAVANFQGVDPTNLDYCKFEAAFLDTDADFEAQRIRELVCSRPGLGQIPGAELLARISVLRVLNARLGRALPLLSFSLPEEDWEKYTTGQGVTADLHLGTTAAPSPSAADKEEEAEKKAASTLSAAAFLWRPPSLARRLRQFRGLAFSATKLHFWNGVLQATTTQTTLPHDEYEDPREIKTIKVNRVRATPQRLASIQNPTERLRASVFGQLHRELRQWRGSDFRRAYLAKGHGGQRRSFKVRFVGEGVNDYGGPYRAVFDQVRDELQFDQLTVGSRRAGECCLLPVLVPCPNRRSGVGDSGRDKYLFMPGQISASPLTQELAQFLGRLVGMGHRHSIQTSMDLPASVWRPLVGSTLHTRHLNEIDSLAARSLARIEAEAIEAQQKKTSPENWEELTMTTHLSDGSHIALVPNGDKILVTLSNWEQYLALTKQYRLSESAQLLRAFRDGLGTALPVELFPLFSAEELERLICGVPTIDVELLQKSTEYEGVSPNDEHVKYFWEIMRELSPEEKTAFLRFVWARTRMPTSTKDFTMNFKLQAPQGSAVERPDDYLPHAQTCFFSLSLPRYSTKEVLRQKLLLAIQNSPNMDADVRLRNADGWADVM